MFMKGQSDHSNFNYVKSENIFIIYFYLFIVINIYSVFYFMYFIFRFTNKYFQNYNFYI